jgi:hypothetical protein
MTTKQLLLAGVVALGASLAAPASAAPVAIGGATGEEGLGIFSGTLSYSASSNTSATLTVFLANTSPADNGGFLTAFVLNNPGDLITGITFSDAAGGGTFSLLGLTNNGISGSPYGDFDFGASTGDAFLGGGSPNTGLQVGDTDTLTFNLTGTSLQSLSESAFINALSANAQGGGAEDFVARFRGFENGGSDKVPNTGGPGPSPGPIPEPASLALFGAGLLGLGFVRRRKGRASV